MIDITKPAMANLIPLLKGLLLGLNIQKLDSTKKNKQIPKNAFNGDKRSADFAL